MLYCCFSEGNLLPLHLSNNKDDKAMKSKIILFFLLLLTTFARANDGSYFISGNQLVPIGSNNDVRIDKEVLTIRLGNDGFAYVDVDYTFFNLKEAQTVRMGFEAADEWHGDERPKVDSLHKGHPFIYDFAVEVNGKPQSFQNLMARTDPEKGEVDYVNFPSTPDPEPYNVKMASVNDGETEDVIFYREKTHVYYFEAHFNKGANKVHHTYRYQMGGGFSVSYGFRYWLTPALRWAGGKIGDFTLRISAEGTAKHFIIYTDKCLKGHEFKIVKGVGKVRNGFNYNSFIELKKTEIVEAVVRDGIVEMTCKDFKPTDDLILNAADCLRVPGNEYGTDEKYSGFADYYEREGCFTSYMSEQSAMEKGGEWKKKVLRSLPYANRGYIFEDKKLQEFFENKWWYMPDPSYVPSTDGFTDHELELIKIGLEE